MIAVMYPAGAQSYPHEAGLGVPGPARDPEPDPGPRACTATTKAGDPCKGTPGDDGLCAAHKPKGDADAGAAVDADSPAEEEGGG